MAGIEKDRNWDKEMAEVDRLLKKLPDADPTLGRDLRAKVEQRLAHLADDRTDVVAEDVQLPVNRLALLGQANEAIELEGQIR